jgi:hypothetical protein
MFDAPVAKRASSDQAEAAEEAFGTLLGYVKSCQDKRQPERRPHTELRV